jgi:SAM-dependent methyltransferase
VEHVPDPIPALSALATNLGPGGRLIATTPNLRPRFPWWWDAEAADPTHVSVHEPDWWRAAFTEAGLQVRRAETFLALPLLWRLHPVLARWPRLGRQTGPGILIVADRDA